MTDGAVHGVPPRWPACLGMFVRRRLPLRRYFPVWLELLLAPLFVLLHLLIRRAVESSTGKVLAEVASTAKAGE